MITSRERESAEVTATTVSKPQSEHRSCRNDRARPPIVLRQGEPGRHLLRKPKISNLHVKVLTQGSPGECYDGNGSAADVNDAVYCLYVQGRDISPSLFDGEMLRYA